MRRSSDAFLLKRRLHPGGGARSGDGGGIQAGAPGQPEPVQLRLSGLPRWGRQPQRLLGDRKGGPSLFSLPHTQGRQERPAGGAAAHHVQPRLPPGVAARWPAIPGIPAFFTFHSTVFRVHPPGVVVECHVKSPCRGALEVVFNRPTQTASVVLHRQHGDGSARGDSPCDLPLAAHARVGRGSHGDDATPATGCRFRTPKFIHNVIQVLPKKLCGSYGIAANLTSRLNRQSGASFANCEDCGALRLRSVRRVSPNATPVASQSDWQIGETRHRAGASAASPVTNRSGNDRPTGTCALRRATAWRAFRPSRSGCLRSPLHLSPLDQNPPDQHGLT